jgi:signal peptidase II
VAFLAGVTMCLVALDQLVKWVTVQNLAVNESWAPIPALAKLFTITHIQNTGVAFGQLGGLGWLFMVVNVVVLVAVLVYYPRIPADQRRLRLACCLILAGDLGNMIDRVRHLVHFTQITGSVWTALPKAYVTDMIFFHFWPVFNVADMCLVSGILIVAWTVWRNEKAQLAAKAVPDTISDSQPTTEA